MQQQQNGQAGVGQSSDPRDPRQGPKKSMYTIEQPTVGSQSWIDMKIREEIGYDRENIYIDDTDEQKHATMTELVREGLLETRREKIAQLEKVYKVRAENELRKQQDAKQQPVKETIYADDDSSSEKSDEEEEKKDEEESDEYVPDKKRDEKAERKKERDIDKYRQVRVTKATERYDLDSESDSDAYVSDDDRDKKYRGRQKEDKGKEDEDLANLDINHKEFNKVILKRKEILKWHEMECFQTYSKDLYAKVVQTTGQYAVGKISDIFTLNNKPFRLENKECKVYVQLTDSKGKKKDFKLQVISDKDIDEDEFSRFKQDFKPMNRSQLIALCKQKKKAFNFLYDKQVQNEYHQERLLKKISERNFIGMDLTNVHIQFSTELHEIREECRTAKEDRQKEHDMRTKENEIRQKEFETGQKRKRIDSSLSDLKHSKRVDKDIARLDDRILELESAVRALEAEMNEKSKEKNPIQFPSMGPQKNDSINIADHWFAHKEAMMKPQVTGSNVFSGRIATAPIRRLTYENEVNPLTASRQALSGFATRESSTHGDFNSMSYYEKMEMLKKKIVETHRKVDSLQDLHVQEVLKRAKTISVNLQPAHPDWQEEQMSIVKGMKNDGCIVIPFEQYQSL